MLKYIGMVVVMVIMMALVMSACSVPVVLEDRNGKMCGCMVADQMVTDLSWCDKYVTKYTYDVIVVSKCQ